MKAATYTWKPKGFYYVVDGIDYDNIRFSEYVRKDEEGGYKIEGEHQGTWYKITRLPTRPDVRRFLKKYRVYFS